VVCNYQSALQKCGAFWFLLNNYYICRMENNNYTHPKMTEEQLQEINLISEEIKSLTDELNAKIQAFRDKHNMTVLIRTEIENQNKLQLWAFKNN